MLSCDPEMCPQPDVQTELSSVVHAQNRKPSVCEITLNQPLTNPQLLQLHQQLISCCKFQITLKISFDIEKLFSEVWILIQWFCWRAWNFFTPPFTIFFFKNVLEYQNGSNTKMAQNFSGVKFYKLLFIILIKSSRLASMILNLLKNINDNFRIFSRFFVITIFVENFDNKPNFHFKSTKRWL